MVLKPEAEGKKKTHLTFSARGSELDLLEAKGLLRLFIWKWIKQAPTFGYFYLIL